MFTYLQGGLIAMAQQRGRNLAQAGYRTDGIKPRFCSRSGKQERKLGIDQGHDRNWFMLWSFFD